MVIETAALTRQYGAVKAVQDLNLRVPEGGIHAFLGPNGHGKSTTIKMLLGITRPTAGAGWVMGLPIDQPRASLEIRRRTGFASEDKQLYAFMTVGQALDFTRSLYPGWRRDRERELLKRFDLATDRKVKQLSKGMRTKLALILALARGAELLILDEPGEGLDPVTTEVMLEEVVRAAGDGATVFFSSHQLSEAERIADQVFILRRGRVVVEGRLDELRESYRRINAVFDGPPPVEQLRAAGIKRVSIDGNTCSALVNGVAGDIADRTRALGALSVDLHPVGLRELFLETVGGQEP
jgi:ABC-2 type transport system ATP-binding protein